MKRALLHYHNLLRTDPKSFIPILEEWAICFEDNVVTRPNDQVELETYEGVAAVRECIEFLRNQKPLPQLKYDKVLAMSAQDHADDIGANDLTDHIGSDDSTPDERISKFLDWDVTVAENLDFGSSYAQDVLISLIVDDGVENRGHRKNIFNPLLKFLGAGIAEHNQFNVCTVLNYCGGINFYKDTADEGKWQASLEPSFNAEKIFLNFVDNFYCESKNKEKTPSQTVQERRLELPFSKPLVAKEPKVTPPISAPVPTPVNVRLPPPTKDLIRDFNPDPENPPNVVSYVEKVINTGIPNYTKVIKTFTLDDGNKEEVEIENF